MKPKIVCVVTNPRNAAAAKKHGADLIELRIDLIKKKITPLAGPNLISLIKLTGKNSRLPVICTIRSKNEGGKYTGSPAQILAIFNEIISYCDYFDFELDSPLLSNPEIKKKRKKIILSRHFFDRMPSFNDFAKIIRKAARFGPAIIKIATLAETQEDLLLLARVQKAFSKYLLALIPMGKLGLVGRFLMPVLGTKLTYGFIKNAVAPGQIHLKELSRIKPFLVN